MTRKFLPSQVHYWARAKGTRPDGMKHAWVTLDTGRLGTACGHDDVQPIRRNGHWLAPRRRRKCRLCANAIVAGAETKLPDHDPSAAAGFKAGLPSLKVTLTELLEAIKGGDRPRQAVAFRAHAAALVMESARQGVNAESVFLYLASEHCWGNNVRDALGRASSYAIRHRPPKLPQLLLRHAEHVQRLQEGDTIIVERALYHLIALLSLHNIPNTFLVDVLHEAPAPKEKSARARSKPAPVKHGLVKPAGLQHGLLPSMNQCNPHAASTPA